MRIIWNHGDGSKKIVLMQEGKAPALPKDGMAYKFNNDISAGGEKIPGTSTYVVFNGVADKSLCDVKGLKPNTKILFYGL